MRFGDTYTARPWCNTRHNGLEILILHPSRYLTTPTLTSQAKVDISATNVDESVLSRASDETFLLYFLVWVTYELSVVAAGSLLGAVGTSAHTDDSDGRAANTEERASHGNGSHNSQESGKQIGIGLTSLQSVGRSVSSRRQRMH